MKTSIDFYDKVAKKFGSYHRASNRIVLKTRDNPEEIFKSKLLALSSKKKTVLDIGCADGQFTLSIARHFENIQAVDLSEEMLRAANKFLRQSNIENVSFNLASAFQTPFDSEIFDLAYSRRGPTPLEEIYRVLKPGGSFVLITIGENDCKDLKLIFKKGQGYGEWNKSVSREIRYQASKIGFKTEYARNLYINEYYPSLKDFSLFLEGVPIFEDFDPVKDKILLEKYTKQFKSRFGVKLNRHRVVAELYKP